jgi:hypothetical protein
MKTRECAMNALIPVLLLLLVVAVPLFGDDSASTLFVDRDGDGIDDMYADENDNSIPDTYESSEEEKPAEPASALGDVFNVGEFAAFAAEDVLSAYSVFCKRQFRARDLDRHRGGFNAGESFGPGNGIGLGLLTSGCVGPGCQGP